MNAFNQYEVWFVTGAQLLYGGDAVIAVDAHSNEMVNGLNESGKLPVKVVYKGTANSSKEVETVFKAANNDEKCIGVITWMHTFSPAKMWIHGLQQLKKPLMHLHTQFNKEIPWDTMDMDFMNLNQSAHGRLLERRKHAAQDRCLDACMCRLGRFTGYADYPFRRPDE